MAARGGASEGGGRAHAHDDEGEGRARADGGATGGGHDDEGGEGPAGGEGDGEGVCGLSLLSLFNPIPKNKAIYSPSRALFGLLGLRVWVFSLRPLHPVDVVQGPFPETRPLA